MKNEEGRRKSGRGVEEADPVAIARILNPILGFPYRLMEKRIGKLEQPIAVLDKLYLEQGILPTYV